MTVFVISSIRQSHGGSYQIPEWMFDQEAGASAIVAVPRLPIGQLILLRGLVDHLIAYSPGTAETPEGSAMKKLSRTQLDLFVTPAEPVVKLTGSERQKAVALLQALLTEVMATTTSNPAVTTKQEAGDE